MDGKRYYVGLGDLVLDVYHGINGENYYSVGGSVWNDLINIRDLDKNSKCYAIGTCGNDYAGEFIKKVLGKFDINVDNVKNFNSPTNRFNLILQKEKETISQLKCPDCGKEAWYSNKKLQNFIPYDLVGIEKGVVIIDNLKKNILELSSLFRSHGWLIACDIGHIRHLRYLTKESLNILLKGRFDYIQITEQILKFLLKKLNIKEREDLFRYFMCKYLIITSGERGSMLIENFKDQIKITEYAIVETKVVDTSGAGDAFFSLFLSSLNENGYCDENSITLMKRASLYASNRVSTVGSNNYIGEKTLFTKKCLCCRCGLEKSFNQTTKLNANKRVIINTNYLEYRITKSLETGAVDKLRSFLDKLKGRVLLVGTGGSYSSALFASKVLNDSNTEIFAYALKPRDFSFLKLRSGDTVILLSYSGKSKDIINVYNRCKSENINVRILTALKIESKNVIYHKDQIISYYANEKNNKERGFISMAGTLIPMFLFYSVYYKDAENDFFDLVKKIFSKRINYFDDQSIINTYDINFNGLVVDIFTGDDTICAATDLESKLIESGLARVSLHEKKDFSHGRFNIIETIKPNIVIIFENVSGKYSEVLYKYLTEREGMNIMVIKTNLGYLLGDIDLVVAVQFFLRKISEMLNFDISNPKYPQEAMKLYRYSNKDIF